MTLKAENIYQLNSGPAPKEWEQIPEILAAKPKRKNCEISLQRMDDTNICAWYSRQTVYWNPDSDFFIITS